MEPTPQPAPAPTSTIETDTFCSACGFNLHTQPVWRDPNLNILLARCPECGQHHPAANRTTAPNTFLGRLAFLSLLAYIGTVLGLTLAIFFGLFGLHIAAQESLVSTQYVTRGNQAVTQTYNGQYQQLSWVLQDDATYYSPTPPSKPKLPTTVPASEIVRIHYIPTWLGGQPVPKNSRYYYNRLVPLYPFLVCSTLFAIATVLAASLLAIVVWFWPARRRYFLLALPLFASLIVFLMYRLAGEGDGIHGIPTQPPDYPLYLIFAVTLLELLFFAIGLRIGRPLGRLTLLLILPPKLRQYFSFLWFADNLTPSLKP